MKRFHRLLVLSNYDKEKTLFLVNGLTYGFNLRYVGQTKITRKAPNLKFSVGSKLELWNKIMDEVRVKRYAGPFIQPPFDHYIQSPIGLVPKDNGKKTRLIFHLSYPRNSELSVNFNTPRKYCTVQYKDFENAIRRCLAELKYGGICYMGKSDLTSAFRILPIRPEVWCWLVMKAENPKDGKTYYFVDKCLPFGHAISCALFQEMSDAMQWIF